MLELLQPSVILFIFDEVGWFYTKDREGMNRSDKPIDEEMRIC